MNSPGAVLIGIGNPFRRDDGVGPALVDAVTRLRLPDVSPMVADGEPSQLLDAWAGAPLAIVVDAVRCAEPSPGRIHRTELAGDGTGPAGSSGPFAVAAAASTHGLGVPDAVRLAAALDRMPGRLVVFAVEAADIGFGHGLSPVVATCLPELTEAVLAELGT